jgi:hypothetical protein
VGLTLGCDFDEESRRLSSFVTVILGLVLLQVAEAWDSGQLIS